MKQNRITEVEPSSVSGHCSKPTVGRSFSIDEKLFVMYKHRDEILAQMEDFQYRGRAYKRFLRLQDKLSNLVKKIKKIEKGE